MSYLIRRLSGQSAKIDHGGIVPERSCRHRLKFTSLYRFSREFNQKKSDEPPRRRDAKKKRHSLSPDALIMPWFSHQKP
jgi:hypothetical protein